MSNYLNFSVKSQADIMDWVLMQLGYPLVQVEITESQLRMCINDAVEEFTKYVIQEESYLALDLEEYSSGFTLPTNVTGIFALEEDGIYGSTQGGINTLFSVQNTMWNAGMFPIPRAGSSGAWIDWHMAKSYLELVKTMTADQLYYEYNPRIQQLTLIPDPEASNLKGHIVVGCYTIRPDDQQYGESWVKRFTLACAKIVIGNVRSKFEGTPLLGGGAINSAIKDEGLGEKEALLEDLQSTYRFTGWFIG